MTAPDQEKVAAEMAKALRTFEGAKILLENDNLDGAISRAYYAAFHAARAALWSKAVAPKTHDGVIQMLGLHFVKTGLLDVETGKVLRDAHEDREFADYENLSGSLDPDDVGALLNRVEKFVTRMEELLESGNY